MTTGETVRPTASATGMAATRALRRDDGDGDVPSSPERVSAVAAATLGRIHQVVREYDVTYAEFQAVKRWLIDLGEKGEWPLFLDVFVEHAVEEVNHASRAGSAGTIRGPYHLPGQRILPAECKLPMRQDEPGAPLIFEGRVTGLDGRPVGGAMLDFWQADANGYYSGFAPGIPEGNLRGVIRSGVRGEFAITTVRPAPYEIPKDGPTGKLIAAANWHAWRPAHLHMIVTAPGYLSVTTQLYFDDDEWLDSDIAQATRPELILSPESDEAGRLRLRHDFVLDPES
jgi:catechol 1,2-dioxygenase